MTGLPDDLRDDWWGTGRAVPVIHALDALLDRMEQKFVAHGCDQVAPGRDILPMSTGVMALDRVLGGGVHRGTLTVIEAEIAAQANALLCTVARSVPHTCLLDGGRFFDTVAWLMAGSADVAEVSVSDGHFSALEWKRVASGLAEFHDQDLRISSMGSLRALGSVAKVSGAEVLLVHDADRFGRPIKFVADLAQLAVSSGLAVIATTGILGDLPDRTLEAVTCVSMHGFNLGGSASLVRQDDEEMLATAQIEVECLSGVVR